MARYAAAHSEHPDPVEAAAEVVAQLGELADPSPDLAVIFASGSHRSVMEQLAEGLRELVGVPAVIGTTARGVVGGGREVEDGAALSAWVGHTGPVAPFRAEAIDGGRTILGLPGELAAGSVMLLLADPFSFPAGRLIEGLDAGESGISVVGGLASGSDRPGGNRLLIDGVVHADGAVGVVIGPGVARPLVSQGCRPIGQPWVITDGSGQMIRTLGGVPAIERLQPMIESLSPQDRRLAADGLHVGIVANQQRERFGPGDFLIRSLIGADRATGAIAVGDRIDLGEIIQFHVRDAESATEDLRARLANVDADVTSALVFTCTGRGTHLFSDAHHDAQAVSEAFSPISVAGMFCAGEVGPVGPRNAVHGFTATMLLFDR